LKGKSLKTLKKLIAELARIFPDQYMHMGSDETAVGGKCTLEGLTYHLAIYVCPDSVVKL